jgi:hypothetical protein
LGERKEQRQKVGVAALISERTFAETHSNFWRAILPRSEQMVRMLNASRTQSMLAYDSGRGAGNRGLINETATRVVRLALTRQQEIRNLATKDINAAASEAHKFIARFRSPPSMDVPELEAPDIHESVQLASRLKQQLAAYWGTLAMFVSIPGAGILDSCEADGVSGQTIIEVKAGNRLCRSRDIRQVLTYVGLATLAAGSTELQTICIVNPRVGWKLTAEVKDVLDLAGGKTFDAFIADFENYVTECPEGVPMDSQLPNASVR